ncbi:hypothetical protein GF377_02810, partial [candidate division GN15 bacterium]|nr:hypothetical protein [candidate division GN15 bacterium]
AMYSLANLWNKQYAFDDVFVDSLVVTLAKAADGSWELPISESSDTSAATPISFVINQLALSQTTLRLVQADGDTAVIDNLSLLASVSGEGGMYSADIKRLDFAANRMSGPVRVLGKVSYADGVIVVQDLQLLHGNTRVKISGTYDPDDAGGAAHIAADQIDLRELTDLVGGNLEGVVDATGNVVLVDNALSGQVTVGGHFVIADIENLFIDFSLEDKLLVFDTVYGTVLNNCSVDGKMQVNLNKPEVYWLEADIRNFNLAELLPNTFPSNLTGRLRLDGKAFGSDELQLFADVELFESSFDDYPLQTASGLMRITTRDLVFPEPFQVTYYENTLVAQGEVDYRNDINLQVDADLPNLDRWRGKLFIDQPGGRAIAHATLTGNTGDPDLHGWLRSDSLWVYGLYGDSAYAEFGIERFLTRRLGEVWADFLAGEAWQIPYDTGRVELSLDSALVNIDTVHLVSPDVQVDGAGLFDQARDPWLLTIDSLELSLFGRDFYNRGQQQIAVDTLGFDFIAASIGKDQTSLQALGRIDFEETTNMQVAVNDVTVSSWLNLFEQDVDFDAYLSGEASLTGSFAEPSFLVDLGMDSMVYQGVVLGDLTVAAQYDQELLTIDSVVVLSDSGSYRGVGYLHADLAFDAATVERFPDRQFDIQITAEDNQFDLVTNLMPSVEDLRGSFTADFRLSGTPTDPHLDGQAVLLDGRLKYFDLANLIYTDSASVTMRDNRIILNQLTSHIKEGERRSYIYADGDITVQSLDTLLYDLYIRVPKQTPFKYELADIEGKFRAELEVRGAPPTITGDVTVFSGRDRSPFPSSREGSPLMLGLAGEDPWDLNINVDIVSNYWIKNDDIDAEFSGFLNITRERGRYRFAGEMDILRGRAFLFDKTFRNPEGGVIFEDVDYPNPRLDMTWETRIPVTTFEEEEQRASEVVLPIRISGTLENPEFSVAQTGTETEFSDEDILPLLVANYYSSDTTKPGQFDQRLYDWVSTRFSQIASRRLGVETFQIDPTYGGEFDLNRAQVTLGAYAPNVSNLYGYTRFTRSQVQEVGFEYRLRKGVLVEGRRELDEQARERYGVNLRLHWEF